MAARVQGYLRGLDAAAPGWVEGAYVVGSTALGAWLADRSDIDLFLLVDRPPSPDELAALRRHHRRTYWPQALGAAARGRYPLVCDVCVLRWPDLARPPAEVTPIASHVAQRFHEGEGFDVNPVGYRTLVQHGPPWGVLGAPRSHATCATGEVLSKAEAAEFVDVVVASAHDLPEPPPA